MWVLKCASWPNPHSPVSMLKVELEWLSASSRKINVDASQVSRYNIIMFSVQYCVGERRSTKIRLYVLQIHVYVVDTGRRKKTSYRWGCAKKGC